MKAQDVLNNPKLLDEVPEGAHEGIIELAKMAVAQGNPDEIVFGKSSEFHNATVIGDTVGDPFKDTSGPALNILIKLMSVVSVVLAGLTAAINGGLGLLGGLF